MEKDFFNIAELTKELEAYPPAHWDNERGRSYSYAKIGLAIAQQLAVISGHLEGIHGAIEGLKK
jgi:hypothetical protein